MSETQTPSPEQSLPHEVLAMADLNIAAKRIFTSYIANRDGYEVSRGKDPTASHESVTSLANGSSITRSTDHEDGTVSYELTTKWAIDGDQGASSFRWNAAIPEIQHEYVSNAQGSLGEEAGSGVTMEHAKDLLERDFPVRVETMPTGIKSPFERLMGKVILWRAQREGRNSRS